MISIPSSSFCLKLLVLAQGKSTSLLFLYDFKKKNCEL